MQSVQIIESVIVYADGLPARLLTMDDAAAGKLVKALSRFMAGEDVTPEESGDAETFCRCASMMEKRFAWYSEYRQERMQHVNKLKEIKERARND